MVVWQLRVVVALTGTLAVGILLALAITILHDRPRSQEEVRDRLREASADPGYRGGHLITATRTGSWILSTLYLAMAVGAGAYFFTVALHRQ